MDYYSYMLNGEMEKYSQGYYDAPEIEYIEWNGVQFPYSREGREINFNYKAIMEHQWGEPPEPGEDGEWVFFQAHVWKALGKPEQVVDATFPFLAFEYRQTPLEDIPIEHF